MSPSRSGAFGSGRPPLTPRLLSFAAARARVLAAAAPLPPESVDVAGVRGRALRETIRAPHALPPFDNSAMDGYAVRASDVARATIAQPVTLPVAMVIPAGKAPTLPLAAGTAAMGAWMVMPFAGAELLLVWLAFDIVGGHDGDYEVLRISDQEFSWERNDRGRICSLHGNRAWVQVVGEPVEGRFELGLRYAGKRVAIANLLSDAQRRALLHELARILRNG